MINTSYIIVSLKEIRWPVSNKPFWETLRMFRDYKRPVAIIYLNATIHHNLLILSLFRLLSGYIKRFRH